ncbi:minor tail protein [Baekduia alba]|uniref:glycosyl hydrolase family 18 protein n=1 Tax=Baekduia alba TaxID=2997333 RepID=UPI00234028D6|nr:glycosyl hydrolase family 18 protein [Baekduia alba]WCB91650.1 minor tail protein [Baekduia alba]
MTLRSLTSFAALAVALALTTAAAPASAAAAPACSTVRPAHLRVAPSTGAADRVIVAWSVPPRRPARLAYRVLRDGAVVGQTSSRRMSIALPPGKRARVTVVAVVGGRPTRCSARITVGGAQAPAGAVVGLAARPGARGHAVLLWDRPAGSAPAGYRILRDGRVAQRVTRPSLTVPMTKRAVRYQVATLDAKGRRGPRSSTVTVQAGHRPPTRPAGAGAAAVTGSSITLSWGRSRAVRGRIAGYRVQRAGRTVKAVRATRVTLPKAAGASYRIVALDTAGWASADSDPITVGANAPVSGKSRPGAPAPHGAPGAPGAPVAAAVGDTTLSLSWSPAPLPDGSALRGYRLIRDGVIVAQVADAQAEVANLEPKSGHDWSVAAVDTTGVVSAPSPVTHVLQADPPPTLGTAQAFLLASTDSSFAAFRKTYRQIGVIYPTFWDCDHASAALGGRNDADIVRFAQDRKVKVLPRINCQSTAILHRILTEPALRETWLSGVVGLVDQYGYDGLNLDFEAVAAADRDALTSFVIDLSGRLHAQGKLLSQDVSPKTKDIPNHPRGTAFDYAAIAPHLDWVFVMAWGGHWSTSAPGPMDDIGWVRHIADYVSTMPNHERFVIGTMLYGMDWVGDGGPDHPGEGRHYPEIQQLIARYGATPIYDADVDSWHLSYTDEAGAAHTVWYPDAATTGRRLAVAREHGLGIGFWRLGQEDDRLWSAPELAVAG